MLSYSYIRAWARAYPGHAAAMAAWHAAGALELAARYARVLAVAGAGYARVAARAALSARRLWLFLAEVAGVVLGTLGIAQWSWPSALIVGGLVLIAAVEVRPRKVSAPPPIGLPGDLLHKQAEAAARAINNARYGVAEVRQEDLAKLTDEDCERLITIARNVGQSS